MLVETTVDYKAGEVACQGVYVYDDAQRAQPLVVIMPTFAGINEFARNKAHQIAGLGYAAFVMDLYGGGKSSESVAECQALMATLRENRALLRERVVASVACVQQLDHGNPLKIAAIGFCFGGMAVLDLARTASLCVPTETVKGVVSFHGLLDAPDIETAEKINAKVLVLHGYEDPMVPVEKVNQFQQEMTAKQADWQLHAYGNTMHSFTNTNANNPAMGTQYNESADRRSWQAMQNFLAELFAD